MASLSLKHIYKVYDGTTKAVSDFNMEIRDREFIVFVGPSGCGKSTTLRMIAGLEDISAGELSIDGTVVNDMEPRDRNIAMVFQNYALYPHMTVYENMAFSLKTAHVPKKEIHEKVTEAARILGITEYLERKPKALSGGQRQRVALGRAIVRHPKVFLFDEPLSNLDAKLRAAMRAEIIRLYERLGTTFIYVTHDQVEAMTMGSRIVVMRGGFVQQIDTPKNLYNHPENLFVAGFIGTPRMNFWQATLEKREETVLLRLAYGENVVFAVPYATLNHVQTRYMDGAHPVIAGVRPDDVRPWEDGLDPESWGKLAVKVHVVEALGGETLIYGRIAAAPHDGTPMDSDAVGTPDVILKASAEYEITRGAIIDVAVNLKKLHIFDQKTEQSLNVRIPTENVCRCTLDDQSVSFAGQRFALPPALLSSADENAAAETKKAPVEGELVLPGDAILLGTGSGRAMVEEVEEIPADAIPHQTQGQEHPPLAWLYRLTVGGETFFARESESEGHTPRFAVGDTLPFDVDFSRISIEAAGIQPLPLASELHGRFTKEKVLDEKVDSPTHGRRVYQFFLEIADQPIEAEKSLSEKLFSCKGSGIFSTALTYRFPADAVTVTPRSEPRPAQRTAISGRVIEVLDYGRMTYARIAVGTRRIIAPYTGHAGETVLLTIDQSRLTILDRDVDMIIV